MRKSLLFKVSLKYFFVFCVLSSGNLVISMHAQKLELGLRAGMHTATFAPKEKLYKGSWERTNGFATDLFGRLQMSDHLFVQLGLGLYERTHKGNAEISSFQGGFELEGKQKIYNLQFIFGGRTRQEVKKMYGFGAFGFAFGMPVNRDFENAIWLKSPVKFQIKGEESSLILEAGLGYPLTKRIKTELSFRYMPTQFSTSQESLTVIVPNLNSNWTLNAFCPGITVILH